MRRFTDRTDAGRRLARPVQSMVSALSALPTPAGPVTLVALPRGGVVVAAALRARLRELGIEVGMAVLPVAKVRHPAHPEVALGAVTRDATVGPWSRDVDDASFVELTATARQDLARRTSVLPPASPTGPAALVVDDGLATGATVEVAIAQLRHDGVRWIGVALPVAEPGTWARILAEVDAGVALDLPVPLHSVGSHYRDFTQVSDEEVRAALGG